MSKVLKLVHHEYCAVCLQISFLSDIRAETCSCQGVCENQVIGAESLSIKNMVKNCSLAKAIHDTGWGEIVRQLEYKAWWYGRTFVQIDKFYPSSKRCSECGYIREKLELNIRSWVCPECGTHHDWDVNAARNILSAGLAILAGADVLRLHEKSTAGLAES